MTKDEAAAALKNRTKVWGGEDEDYDTGYIISIDGDMAIVAWDCEQRTPCPIAELEIV